MSSEEPATNIVPFPMRTMESSEQPEASTSPKMLLLCALAEPVPWADSEDAPALLRLIRCVDLFVITIHRLGMTVSFNNGNKATPHYLYRLLIKNYSEALAHPGAHPTAGQLFRSFFDFLEHSGFTFRLPEGQ